MLTLIAKTASAAALLGAVISADTQSILPPAEETLGWKLLSGPDAPSRWHAFKKQGFPSQGWKWGSTRSA